EDLLSKPLSEIKPGDKIRGTDVTMNGDLYTQWETVESITPDTGEHGGSVIDGKLAIGPDSVVLRTSRCLYTGYTSDKKFRVAASAEVKRAALEKAIEFQNSLTK